jgi:hypothetical protein
MKTLLLATLTLAGFTAFTGGTQPAAAAGCYYHLYQDGHGIITGKLAVRGVGHAAKLETACNRARRECNRRFERARKKGQLPRGGPRDFRCVRGTAG